MTVEIKHEDGIVKVTRPTYEEICAAGNRKAFRRRETVEWEEEEIKCYCLEFYKLTFNGRSRILHCDEFEVFWDMIWGVGFHDALWHYNLCAWENMNSPYCDSPYKV